MTRPLTMQARIDAYLAERRRLGFTRETWEYAFHWRQPNLDHQPLALDHPAFGELVHTLIGGVLRDDTPRNVDEIEIPPCG